MLPGLLHSLEEATHANTLVGVCLGLKTVVCCMPTLDLPRTPEGL